MSEYFRGITFSEQTVTPIDDAVVRRAILPDGIVTGCEISYSGSTLTMAPGFLIACGRLFQHTTVQNWPVVDATSGFARLLLTIDLTKTATETSFNQIDAAIEYATSKNGFIDIDQQDVNGSGTRYQIVMCVVSLGTGGITGIVEEIEAAQVAAGLSLELLWENSSPTVAFAPQTINVEMPEGIHHVLGYFYIYGQGLVLREIALSGQFTYCHGRLETVDGYRTCAALYSGIVVGEGRYVTSGKWGTDNGVMVPWRFFAVKEG